MMQRFTLTLAACLLAALPLTGHSPVEEASLIPAPPNIIYILADDLGYGDLGSYGQELFGTPRLDELASEGIRFTRHYSGSTVCAPSRSVLLTGLHSGHTPIRGNKEIKPEGQAPLPATAVTLPELLQDAGYVTGAFGKWGLGFPGSEGDPLKQGFDVFFGYNCQRIAHRYYPEYLWDNDEKYYLEGNDWSHTVTYAPDVIQEKTLDFIRENKDKKFFAYVPMVIPHAELIAPEDELMERYRGKFEEEPYKGLPGANYGPLMQVSMYCSQPEPRATFAAMVARLDRQVGEIVDLLRVLGLAENTVIMFSSDNGPHQEGGADPEFFNSNGGLRGVKRDLYEGGIRVPFLVSWPGVITGGQTSNHVSAFWDVLPTCAHLAGMDAPETDGISFFPSLMGKVQKPHEYLYWEFHEKGGKQAILKDAWKAVRLDVKQDRDGPLELYHLEDDPAEANDVAAKHPELVAELAGLMKEARTPSRSFNFGRKGWRAK